MELIFLNGATKGLGLELVKKIVNYNNYKLICLVRDKDRISSLEEFLEKINTYQCDYSNINDAMLIKKKLFDPFIDSKFHRVFFINNISFLPPVNIIGELSNNDVITNLTVNILSNFLIINNFLKSIKHFNNQIFLLNISSGISQRPVPGLFLYGMSKSFLDYLTKTIELENSGRRSKINVASFYPGGMKTDMQNDLNKFLYETKQLKNFNYDNILNQKLKSSQEVAEIIFSNFIEKTDGWREPISTIYKFIENK